MPSERRRKTKEDTWGTEELSKSIKDAMRDDSARKHRSHDKEKRRDGERTKDREHRKDKEQRDRDKDKERRRDKLRSEDSKDAHKDKTRDRNKEDRHKEDKDRRHRNEAESSRNKDRHREDRERRDKERKHKENGERHPEDKDKGRDRRHRDDRDRRHRDEKDKDRERRHKDDKERQSHDKDKERRHRDDKEGHKNRDTRDSENREKHTDRKKKEETNDDAETGEERQTHRRKSKYDEDTGESLRHRSEDKRSEEKQELDQDEENKEEDDDGYGYEDDFEDYEDDFEDDEDEGSEDNDDEEESVATRQTSAELDAIRKAMANENEAMHSSRRNKETNSSANSSRSTTAKSSRSFVNFVAAKQRQINSQVMEHSRKRGKHLMNLIELDVVGFDLFDMAPVREYELYIKSFGRSNTKQAFVQCNEDNLDRDIQTDPIENREIWTQHPAEGVAAFGGAGHKSDADELVNEADSLRLTKFLQKAGQAINILLEEEASDNAQGTLESNQRSIIFSDGYTQLNSTLSFLKERHVIHAQFHPIQSNLLLTVHSLPKKVDRANNLSNRGLLCVWNVNEPFRPQKILSCKSTPTCCVFSPTKSTLAFAGTIDGSIVVWDLREPSSMHISEEFDGQEWSIRVPTFSTDGIQSQENHHSPVVTMQPIVAAEESLKASMQSAQTNGITDGLSFQLASLEEQGIIHFSVVIEIDRPDEAGSESDLGLVPSGKIKLIKTSSVSLATSPSRGLGVDAMKAFHMQLSPLDPNQFFVATDSGHIIHGARHGGKVPPRIYRDQLDLPVDIVQIDFSPFGLPVFLVACGDGSIRLHNVTSDLPVITWNNSTNGMSIKNIQWSRSRPSVFYVMDQASKVYVWELLENDGAPVKTEQFTHASLTFLTLSSDHPGSARGQPNRRQEMLITDAKGALDVHRINKTFSTAKQDELNDMVKLLNKIT